jgi:hypothetical protein
MDITSYSTTFWIVVGLAFAAIEVGIVLLLVLLSSNSVAGDHSRRFRSE